MAPKYKINNMKTILTIRILSRFTKSASGKLILLQGINSYFGAINYAFDYGKFTA